MNIVAQYNIVSRNYFWVVFLILTSTGFLFSSRGLATRSFSNSLGIQFLSPLPTQAAQPILCPAIGEADSPASFTSLRSDFICLQLTRSERHSECRKRQISSSRERNTERIINKPLIQPRADLQRCFQLCCLAAIQSTIIFRGGQHCAALPRPTCFWPIPERGSFLNRFSISVVLAAGRT